MPLDRQGEVPLVARLQPAAGLSAASSGAAALRCPTRVQHQCLTCAHVQIWVGAVVPRGERCIALLTGRTDTTRAVVNTAITTGEQAPPCDAKDETPDWARVRQEGCPAPESGGSTSAGPLSCLINTTGTYAAHLCARKLASPVPRLGERRNSSLFNWQVPTNRTPPFSAPNTVPRQAWHLVCLTAVHRHHFETHFISRCWHLADWSRFRGSVTRSQAI